MPLLLTASVEMDFNPPYSTCQYPNPIYCTQLPIGLCELQLLPFQSSARPPFIRSGIWSVNKLWITGAGAVPVNPSIQALDHCRGTSNLGVAVTAFKAAYWGRTCGAVCMIRKTSADMAGPRSFSVVFYRFLRVWVSIAEIAVN